MFAALCGLASGFLSLRDLLRFPFYVSRANSLFPLSPPMRRTGKKAKAWFSLFSKSLVHENSFKLMKEFSVIEKQPRGHANSLLAAGFFSAAHFKLKRGALPKAGRPAIFYLFRAYSSPRMRTLGIKGLTSCLNACICASEQGVSPFFSTVSLSRKVCKK